MTTEPTSLSDPVRIAKARGILVSIDLLNRIILIESFKHKGRKVQKFRVVPESQIVVGSHLGELTCLRIGDPVRVIFSERNGEALLKRLYVKSGLFLDDLS